MNAPDCNLSLKIAPFNTGRLVGSDFPWATALFPNCHSGHELHLNMDHFRSPRLWGHDLEVLGQVTCEFG